MFCIKLHYFLKHSLILSIIMDQISKNVGNIYTDWLWLRNRQKIEKSMHLPFSARRFDRPAPPPEPRVKALKAPGNEAVFATCSSAYYVPYSSDNATDVKCGRSCNGFLYIYRHSDSRWWHVQCDDENSTRCQYVSGMSVKLLFVLLVHITDVIYSF